MFIDVPFEETIRRAIRRDAELFGSSERARERYERKYIPGQQLYFVDAAPRTSAHVVIDKRTPEHPRFVGRG